MKNTLLLVVVSVWLSGCALTTDRIDLSYAPQTGVSAIPGASDVVVSVNVNDQRQEKSEKVSCKKNGFGMEMAPILVNEEVTITFRRAIEQELQSRGFKIGNQAIVSIVADLTKFWNDHKVGFFAGDSVAELNITVAVKNKSGNILYTRHILTQGVEPNIQLMTGENARLALDKALESGMKQLFEDPAFIAALLDVSKKSTS
jgi:uncharacterized lipoprotein YajG